MFKGLDFRGAVEDIIGGVKYLKENHGVKKVALTGFCMGGALTLAAAAIYPDAIDCIAPFYGIPNDQLCNVENIKIPTQLHFGTLDASVGFSSPKDQDLLESRLKKSGCPYEFYRYEGAKHAFTHKGGPNYDEDATQISRNRMFEFLKKHLEN